MASVADMALYTLAFAFGSCEVERQGRVMNLTKTSMRTNLGDDDGEIGAKHMFLYLCFLKSEMPALEHVDFKRLIRRWKERNHMDASSKRRKGATGKVLKRLAREGARRSHTPIGVERSKWEVAGPEVEEARGGGAGNVAMGGKVDC